MRRSDFLRDSITDDDHKKLVPQTSGPISHEDDEEEIVRY